MKKTRYVPALACLLIISIFTCGAEASAVQITPPQNGMVVVFSLDERKQEASALNAGFALDGNDEGAVLFLTSYEIAENDSGAIGIGFGYNGKPYNVRGSVAYADPDLGIAIISAATPIPRTPVTLGSATDLSAGQSLMLLGFEKDCKNFESGDVVYTEGKVIDPAYDVGGLSCLKSSCDVDFLSMGGPVVTEDGVVVGINLSSSMMDGTSFALPMDYLMQTEIDEGQDTLPVQKNESQADNPQNHYLILIIVIGACVGAYFIAIKIRAKNSALYAGANLQPGGWQGQADPVHAPQAVNGSPRLYGVSGYFSGNSIAIHDRITIGRDQKRCNLVFPGKTPGVSALHCELRYVAGQLELIDLGSTYGTFIGDGTRLEGNRPYLLNAGETFYLGSPDNKFMIGAGLP